MPLFHKGEEFRDPINPDQGYRFNRDVEIGETIRAHHFDPIGGAEKPEDGKAIPDWLFSRLRVWPAPE
jgi:hypothetical protein